MSARRWGPTSYREEYHGLLTPCWTWLGVLTREGYGRIRAEGRYQPAHRYFYRMAGGRLPGGMTIDHLCRNRACVNPGHLEPVPTRTNTLRGVGPSAMNAVRLSCVNSHPFTDENTYITPDGRRMCRECSRERNRRWREREAERRQTRPRPAA